MQETSYLGYRMTIGTDPDRAVRINVHGAKGARAQFGSMAAARSFVRFLRRQR